MDPTTQKADAAAPDAPRAWRREWTGLAVLALACLLYAMDLTVLHLAVPSLSEDLRPSSTQLLWITGATLAPSTLSLIFSMFTDPRQRSTAIGIWITSFSAGGAIGPVLGGVLLERFWWGSVC